MSIQNMQETRKKQVNTKNFRCQQKEFRVCSTAVLKSLKDVIKEYEAIQAFKKKMVITHVELKEEWRETEENNLFQPCNREQHITYPELIQTYTVPIDHLGLTRKV